MHVHEPADLERAGELLRLVLEARDRLRRERARRQRARAVARVDTGLLDVLHDPGHDHRFAVAQSIDVDLDRVGEVAIEQQRVLAEHRVDLARLVVRIARLDV